jgi:uncharacterized membrane protein
MMRVLEKVPNFDTHRDENALCALRTRPLMGTVLTTVSSLPYKVPWHDVETITVSLKIYLH